MAGGEGATGRQFCFTASRLQNTLLFALCWKQNLSNAPTEKESAHSPGQEPPLAGVFIRHEQTIPFRSNDTWLNICLPNHAPSAAHIPLTNSKPWVRTQPGHSLGKTRCSELNSFIPNSIDSSQPRVVKHVFVSKLHWCDSDIDTQAQLPCVQ